jgi:hypothetical protein
LTLTAYKILHVELWQWLIDNPAKDPQQWRRWKFWGGNITPPKNWRFGCVVNREQCVRCGMKNICDENIFAKWRDATTQVDKIKYAEIIRDGWK